MNFNKNLSKIDLTFMLSIVIGMSFLFTYIYKVGYFIALDIPFMYLFVETKQVVFTMIILVILIFVLYIFTNLYIFFLGIKVKGKRIFRAFSRFLPIYEVINNKEVLSKTKEEFEILQEDINKEKLNREYMEKGINYNIDEFEEFKKIKNLDYETIVELQDLEERNSEFKKIVLDLKKDEKERNEEMEELNSIITRKTNDINQSFIIQYIHFMFFLLYGLFCFYFGFTGHFVLSIILVIVYLFFNIQINRYFFNRKYFVLGLLMLTFFLFYVFIGSYVFSSEIENFYTFEKDEQDYIILEFYKDKYLYVDIKDDKLGDKFNLISVDQIHDIKLKK